MKLLRSFVRLAGRALLGGAVVCLALGVALLAVGAYLVAVPASKLSRRHAQLVAFAGVAQAIAALAGAMRPEPGAELELELDDDEPT